LKIVQRADPDALAGLPRKEQRTAITSVRALGGEGELRAGDDDDVDDDVDDDDDVGDDDEDNDDDETTTTTMYSKKTAGAPVTTSRWL
jgi:hypothetical protein